MSVGKKVITTQLLDVSVNKNFESVKDGVGKPLSMAASDALLGEDIKSFDVKLESFINALGNTLQNITSNLGNIAGNVKGAIENIIGGISNAVSNFISKVLQTAGRAFKAIGGALKQIVNTLQLDKVLNMAKKAIKSITDLLRIPFEFVSNIFTKAKNFIKSMLSTLGSTLRDKQGLSNLAGSNQGLFKFTNTVSNIFTTGILGAIFGGIKYPKDTLSSITNKLVEELGFDRVANSYRYLFNKEKNLPKHYYEVYDALGKNRYKNDPSGYNIFKSRYGNRNYRNSRLHNSKPNSKKELFDILTDIGFNKDSSQDLAKIANNKNIDILLPNTLQGRQLNKSYEDQVRDTSNRNGLSSLEKLNSIRHTSGLIQDKPSELESSDEVFLQNTKDKRAYQLQRIRYQGEDYGSIFTKYKYTGKWRNINRPLEFLRPNEEVSVLADLTKKTESEQIASMVGVINGKPKDIVGMTDFTGYTKTTSIKEPKIDLPKPIHESKDIII